MRLQRLAALLAALGCLLILSGCAESGGETEELAVRACVCAEPESLDPAHDGDNAAQSIFCAVYENLMRMSDCGDGTAAAAPGIAKEYKETVNFDGTVEYAFTLRSSARWSDGKRVKAKDFVYAWRRLVNPDTESPYHALLSMVSGYEEARESGDLSKLAVRAESDTVLRVTLSAPCPYFLSGVCTAAATMPLRSDVVTAGDEDWATGNAVVGNGPFAVERWTPGESLLLRRNGSYYESRLVGPDTLCFFFADSDAETLERFASGELDYLAPLTEDASSLPGELRSLPLCATCCVLYDHMSEFFSDAHLRRAFDLAIDRSALAKAVGAAAVPATAYVPYGVPDGSGGEEDFRTAGGELCAVDEEGYSRRCEQAKEELSLAALPEDAAPVLLFVEEDGTAVDAELLREMWQNVLGISVTVEGLSREAFDGRIADGDYDLAIDTLSEPYGDAATYLERFGGTDGNNVLHYASGVYDVLLGVAGASEKPNARAAFLHDAEALLFEDAALSPLHFGASFCLVGENVQGICHDAQGNAYFAAATRAAAEG